MVDNRTGQKFVSKPLRDRDGYVDWVQVMLAILAVVAILFFSLVVYWLVFDDNPPMEIISSMPISTISVPGGEVSHSIEFIKHTDAPVERNRIWICRNTGASYLIIDDKNPPPNKPGYYEFEITVPVPPGMPPSSDYYLFTTFSYPINPLRERIVEMETGPFTIVGNGT